MISWSRHLCNKKLPLSTAEGEEQKFPTVCTRTKISQTSPPSVSRATFCLTAETNGVGEGSQSSGQPEAEDTNLGRRGGDHFCAAYLCNLSLGVWVRRGEENKKKEKIRRVWEDLRNRLPSISSPAPSLANHKWLDPRLQLALVWTSSPQLLTLSITKLTTAPSLFGRWTAITRHNQRGWPRI